jgi:hypothetical protein
MSDDIQYYQQRALVERSRARTAPTPEIAAIHGKLAELYDDFITSLDPTEATSNVVELLPLRELPQARSGTGSQ